MLRTGVELSNWRPSPEVDEVEAAVQAAGSLLDVARILGEIMRVLRPGLHARTTRMVRVVEAMAADAGLPNAWEFELAAGLSQIGCLTLPEGLLSAAARGEALDDEADRALASHPLLARDLLGGAMRFGAVAEMIARQREPYSVSGWIGGGARRDRLDVGGQLLRIAGDADDLARRGLAADAIVAHLRSRPEEYDPALVDCLARCGDVFAATSPSS